jgi:hypothetical protein
MPQREKLHVIVRTFKDFSLLLTKKRHYDALQHQWLSSIPRPVASLAGLINFSSA